LVYTAELLYETYGGSDTTLGRVPGRRTLEKLVR